MEPRTKVYAALTDITRKYHFAPLSEGPTKDHVIPKNLVFMALTYLLDKNHLLVGEPGWGKTTGAKILASKLSGLPYDLYDALEIRGHPQKYEEKLVGRPHYGRLASGEELVIWQGSFGLSVMIIDEANRLPLDSQDVILQGIDTGRWNYLNRSLFEGKKPTFATMNERTGNHENGFLPALKDRLDIVTEQVPLSTLMMFELDRARLAVNSDLCNYDYVEKALAALSKEYRDFSKSLAIKPIPGHLTTEEKAAIQKEIYGLDITKGGNDAMLFLQAFAAEINFSIQYGYKRVADPVSEDTHDKIYAGTCVQHSFSPRSQMATLAYAQALAWFMQQDVSIDHVRYVLPYVFAHKAGFTTDYKDKHGNTPRKEGDNESINLAKILVNEVHERYVQSIQPMKNFISMVQSGIAPSDIAAGFVTVGGQKIELDPTKHDHPLMKDFIRQVLEPDKAFYE
jgi:MoxR-like ATPase